MAALDSVAWRGIMPGLERTRALLASLGNPQVGLRGVLVAGTNGKGSVCATVDSVCRAAGYRSVLITSPHFISYIERIVRDGSPVTETEFGALVARVWEAAEALPEELQPTGFEVLTAAGILAAREADAEVLVCEVGLGGRLDSTNVLDLGVAVVTNVALDHQDLLGETIPEIAREKAAIIKPGNLVVTGASEPALTEVRSESCSGRRRADRGGSGRAVHRQTQRGCAASWSTRCSTVAPSRCARRCAAGFRSPTSPPRWRSATRCARPASPSAGRRRPRVRDGALAGTHGLDRRGATAADRRCPQPGGHGRHGRVRLAS